MKIIHTVDWHIGKIVNEYHMTKDQEYILDQFLHIVREEKPQAIIIAGVFMTAPLHRWRLWNF